MRIESKLQELAIPQAPLQVEQDHNAEKKQTIKADQNIVPHHIPPKFNPEQAIVAQGKTAAKSVDQFIGEALYRGRKPEDGLLTAIVKVKDNTINVVNSAVDTVIPFQKSQAASTVTGAVIGGLIGLIGGPPGVVLGALIGGWLAGSARSNVHEAIYEGAVRSGLQEHKLDAVVNKLVPDESKEKLKELKKDYDNARGKLHLKLLILKDIQELTGKTVDLSLLGPDAEPSHNQTPKTAAHLAAGSSAAVSVPPTISQEYQEAYKLEISKKGKGSVTKKEGKITGIDNRQPGMSKLKNGKWGTESIKQDSIHFYENDEPFALFANTDQKHAFAVGGRRYKSREHYFQSHKFEEGSWYFEHVFNSDAYGRLPVITAEVARFKRYIETNPGVLGDVKKPGEAGYDQKTYNEKLRNIFGPGGNDSSKWNKKGKINKGYVLEGLYRNDYVNRNNYSAKIDMWNAYRAMLDDSTSTAGEKFKNTLLGTGNRVIVENTKRRQEVHGVQDHEVDKYWGAGANGNGENRLGIMLMEMRRQLRDNRKLDDKPPSWITDNDLNPGENKPGLKQKQIFEKLGLGAVVVQKSAPTFTSAATAAAGGGGPEGESQRKF